MLSVTKRLELSFHNGCPLDTERRNNMSVLGTLKDWLKPELSVGRFRAVQARGLE